MMTHKPLRAIFFSDSAKDDPVLSSFADEVGRGADVEVYALGGPLRFKDGVTPPIQPEKHVLSGGREAWVTTHPVMPATGRPLVMIVAEASR